MWIIAVQGSQVQAPNPRRAGGEGRRTPMPKPTRHPDHSPSQQHNSPVERRCRGGKQMMTHTHTHQACSEIVRYFGLWGYDLRDDS